MGKVVNLMWVLKTKIVYDILYLRLVLKVENKEYNTIDEISEVLEKILNIRATRIKRIIHEYLGDGKYNKEEDSRVIEYAIVINKLIESIVNDTVEELEKKVYNMMCELNEIRFSISEAKKKLQSEYVIDESIYNIENDLEI